MRSESFVAGKLSRDRVVIASCILLLTLLAWVYLFRLDHEMSVMESMARMGMPMDMPWTTRDFLLTFAMWSVMMVGMMAPTAMPVLLLFAQMRKDHKQPLAATVFGLGHVTIWIGFSAIAASLQWALHRVTLLSSGMVVTSPYIAGIILIGAGIYQLTPVKAKCLTKCQSPLGFLMSNWREGSRGAFVLGTRHGAYCLGCCWALMLVLFVVGVMNLAWVAVLTVFIFIEKFGPRGLRLARIAGVVIILAGVLSMFYGQA